MHFLNYKQTLGWVQNLSKALNTYQFQDFVTGIIRIIL